MKDIMREKEIALPVRLTISVRNNWIEKYGEDSIPGNCNVLVKRLSKRLTKRKIKHTKVCGWIYIQDGSKWYHRWITIDNTLYDPATFQIYGQSIVTYKTKYIY